MKYILSVDQGTSSTRTIIFDEMGEMASVVQKEHQQIYPFEAWVEHNPIEIKNSVIQTINLAIKKAKINHDQIASIGITNQRETIVAWNKHTGIPCANAIVWQCRRTSEQVETLKKNGHEKLFHKKTGLLLDAYFSGTKIKWLIENNPKIKDKIKTGEVVFGTIDSWIIYFLSGKHVTDASNASRTLLYDLHSKSWSEELAEILEVPIESLAEVRSNLDDPFGYYSLKNVNIPITGVLGDQQAALFGQIAFNKGECKTTYGTGNFTLLNTGSSIEFSTNGLLTTIAWEIDHKTSYAIEGSVFTTGALLRWLRDELNLITSYNEIDKIAGQVQNNGGVYLVPAFVGLGAPYWDPTARGSIFGLTAGTNKSHIIRAALDAIAFQTDDLLKLIESETKLKLQSMRVDGGITKSKILMQRQADLSQINIEIPKIIETTALGAALIAGLGTVWQNFDELRSLNPKITSYSPKQEISSFDLEKKMWRESVNRSKNWI